MATQAENAQAMLDAAIAKYIAFMADGNHKPTYSAHGVSVDWNGYRKSLLDEVDAAQKLLQALSGPFEVRSVGRTV